MNLKKAMPRGYGEISQFIEKLYKKTFFQLLKTDVDTALKNYLEDCSRRRLSVVRCLLHIFSENHLNDYKSAIVALLLSKCDADKSLDAILEFFESDAADRLKRKLLFVLGSYQKTDKVASLIRHFKNKEWIGEYALNALLKQVGSNGENIGYLFQYIEHQPLEFYQTLIANLTQRTDDESIWLLGVLAEFPDESIAETAIQALGYRKSPLAYEILDNLITPQISKKNVRIKAMNRLAQTGVSKTNHRLLIPHKSYLSWIDGNGNSILLVSRRTGRGRLFMVTFMLNEESGIQDCTVWNNISTFEMDSLIKGLEMQVGLKQIDYTLGIKMVEDSLWTTIKNKKLISPTFLVARRIFGSQKLTPRPYEVNLENIGIQYVYKKADALLKESDRLLSEVPFKEWVIEHPRCYEFVKSRPSLATSKKIRKDILAQFIKSLMEEKRENWRHRFLMCAEFLQRTSPRTYRQQIEICLAIYLSIEKGTPLHSIPFMLKLAENTLLHVQEKVFEKMPEEVAK